MNITLKGHYLSHETRQSQDGTKTYHNAQVLLDTDETVRVSVKDPAGLKRNDIVNVIFMMNMQKGTFFGFIGD